MKSITNIKPQVTVITAVYNGMPYLREAIESILNQTYSNFEYLIIDDASTDIEVVKLIESYTDSRIRFIKNEKNLGVSKTINKALSMTTTPYVIRLDQDDISLPNRIKEQISYLESNPNISIVCSWEHIIDLNGKKGRDWKNNIKNYGEFIGTVLLGLCPIWHPSIAFRKDAIIEIGGFNPNYNLAEDYELTTRLALKRYNADIIPEFHLLQRQHSQSQSKKFADNLNINAKRIHNDAICNFIPAPDGKKLAALLRLEKKINNNHFNRDYLVFMQKLLKNLFYKVAKEQELNSNELQSFKSIIYRRIGLGMYLMPIIKYFPSFMFMPIFYLFSPLFLNPIYNISSKIYNAFK